MPKQVMNYNKLTFYILFSIIYVTQLSQCKVAYRREDGEGTNDGQGNLIPNEGIKDEQPIEANDAVADQHGDDDGIRDDYPDPIEANGAVDDQQSPKDGDGAVDDQQSPKDGDGAVADQQNPNDADGIKEDQPVSIEADGAVEDQQSKDAEGIKEGQPADSIEPDGIKEGEPADSIEPDGIKEGKPADSIEPDGIKEGQPADSIEPDGAVEDQQIPKSADGTNVKQLSKDGAGNGCWISFKEDSHFQKMNQLEQKYKNARDAYDKDVNTQQLNQRILSAMVQTRGIAERALQKFHGDPHVIPAGLNLGSNCMMRMPGSMLFFYRLKLRNDTRFTVNFIHNDLKQLTLTLRLSLNDLHLVGEYERALTDKEDPSKLYYRPNKGEVEFLLQDVKYKVEGRYRLLDGRLHLEHVISEIPPMPILMRYTLDNNGKSTPLDPISLGDYLYKMQVDLDHWLKDYFNDFLMLYGSGELKKNSEIQQYENEKTVLLNQFTDQVMDILNNRVKLKGPEFMMPNFQLTAANGMEIKLYDGVVRGLNTMYRRSVTTSKRVNEVRFIDADIGFSKLKSEYRYDVFVKTGVPPVSGVFVLNSEDVSAHMALQIVGYKPSVPDLLITYMHHGKPESLTVEGPASRIIANFKHLLENHIISIMTSTLIHQIRSLSSLAQCDPHFLVKDGADNSRDTVTDGEYKESDGEYDMTTPMKPKDDDDDEPTEMPYNENDENGSSEQPGNEYDEGGPSEYSDNENYDGPTELPDNSDDDGPAEQTDSQYNDVPSEPAEDDNDYDPTESPENSRDKPSESEHNDAGAEPSYLNGKKPEYAFDRKESIELELPSKDGSAPGESYKIDHNETFSLKKLNNDGDRMVLSAAGDAGNVVALKKDNGVQVVKLMASAESE